MQFQKKKNSQMSAVRTGVRAYMDATPLHCPYSLLLFLAAIGDLSKLIPLSFFMSCKCFKTRLNMGHFPYPGIC